MNSVLALALAAQVVVANPLVRRQISSTVVGVPTTRTLISSILSSVEATPTETVAFPTPTYLSSVAATPTAGGSDGSYWFCSFPGSEPTGTYTIPESTLVPTDTITASFPVITSTLNPISETDSATETDTDTDTETLSDSVFKRQVVTSSRAPTASVTTLTSASQTATDTDTFTDLPSPSETLTATFPDPTIPLTTDFPITATATASPGGWVSTYTIVGPETTAVIECIRVPRYGGHHHGPPRPHPYPPHHGTGSVTWSGPVPTVTSVVETDFPSATDTEIPSLTTTLVSSSTASV